MATALTMKRARRTRRAHAGEDLTCPTCKGLGVLEPKRDKPFIDPRQMVLDELAFRR